MKTVGSESDDVVCIFKRYVIMSNILCIHWYENFIAISNISRFFLQIKIYVAAALKSTKSMK